MFIWIRHEKRISPLNPFSSGKHFVGIILYVDPNMNPKHTLITSRFSLIQTHRHVCCTNDDFMLGKNHILSTPDQLNAKSKICNFISKSHKMLTLTQLDQQQQPTFTLCRDKVYSNVSVMYYKWEHHTTTFSIVKSLCIIKTFRLMCETK